MQGQRIRQPQKVRSQSVGLLSRGCCCILRERTFMRMCCSQPVEHQRVGAVPQTDIEAVGGGILGAAVSQPLTILFPHWPDLLSPDLAAR